MRAPIASFVCAALMTIPMALYAQKPVRQGVTSVQYMEPPATPAGLYAASHAIVLVRVTGEHGMESVQSGQRILTEIVGTILEVVKPSSQVGPIGAPIAFRVSGGEMDRGDHTERITDPDQPKLLAGHDYIVALTWDPTEAAFFPAFGPGAIFEVTGGAVTPQRKTALAATIKGIGLRQLVSQMKRADKSAK